MQRIAKTLIILATLACLAFGLVSTVRFVGLSSLFPLATVKESGPIVYDDYALQFYYGQLGSQFLAEGGVTYGYDPYFMAGYVKTPFYYPSSKPFELSLRLFSGFDPGVVFNFTVFFMFAALPLLMYAAAAIFGLTHAERLIVVALSTLLKLLVPLANWYGIMEAAGMVPYIFACFFSVLVVSLVSRFIASGGFLTGLALLVAGPLLFWTHLSAAMLTAIPVATLYLWNFRRIPARRHGLLWLVLAGLIFANWPWIKGYLLFGHYVDLSDFYTQEGMQHFRPRGGLLAPIRVVVPSPGFVALIPPVFGALGLFAWWRERRTREVLIFAPQIAFLFAITFYGTYLGLSAAAPGRLTLPLGLYLFFPAAHGLIAFARRIWRSIESVRPPRLSSAIKTAAVSVVILALAASGLAKQAWYPYSIPQLQGQSAYNVHGRAFIDWLGENTDSRGRILHEETDRMTHQYYGSHMVALVPFFTGREFASGPAPYPLIKHNFLRFIAGTLRNKPLESMESGRLLRYLSLYNVRWVLCWSDSAKKYFDRLRTSIPAGEYDKFNLYRIDLPHSYFAHGSGRLEITNNRILLSDIVPEDNTVTLKYHWLETLRSDPPRIIRPVFMLDDPVPFISIVDPPENLVIYNDYDTHFDGFWNR